MFWVHFFITIFLFNAHSSLGVIYVIGLVIYYANKSSKAKNKPTQFQSNIPYNSHTFRTQPPINGINTGVIDVGSTMSPRITYTNPYTSEQDFYYARDVGKRLNATGEDKKFIQRLWGRRTNFLAIQQCEDETTKLYLFVMHSLKEYKTSSGCSETTKKFLDKLFTERTPSIFDSNFFNLGTQSFANDLYKLCENVMRKNYHHNRKLDEAYYTKGVLRFVDTGTVEFVQTRLTAYSPDNPTDKTKERLGRLTPSAWKEELRAFKSEISKNGYSESIKKKLNETVEINKYNPQFSILCFEACKLIAEQNKIDALVYYMLYKGAKLVKGQPVDDLPVSAQKIIFKGDDERYDQFTALGLNITVSELRIKIEDIFKEKRREIVINPEIVEQKRQLDGKVVSEINKILSDGEEGKFIKEASSINDIFTIRDMKEEVEFTEMQKKFLKQFVSENYTLPREIIDSFSKKNNIFPTILINEINEMFYEVHEDNLILEEGEAYIISDIYRSTIQI